jgi:hypothetical protein
MPVQALYSLLYWSGASYPMMTHSGRSDSLQQVFTARLREPVCAHWGFRQREPCSLTSTQCWLTLSTV